MCSSMCALEIAESRGRRGGDAVKRGRRASEASTTVVFEYQQEDVGIAAGKLAVRLLNHLIYDTEA